MTEEENSVAPWSIAFKGSAHALAEKINADFNSVSMHPSCHPLPGDRFILKTDFGDSPFLVLRRDFDLTEVAGAGVIVVLGLVDDWNYEEEH